MMLWRSSALHRRTLPVQDVDVDKQWPDRPDDLAALAEADTAALRGAIGAVEAAMSGRDVPELEAQLVHELRARDVFMSREEVHLEARRISDPDWAHKDPAALERLLADISSPAKAQEEAALEEQWDRVSERLESALDRMWRLRRSSLSTHRTVDGVWFEVRIDPCSPRRAKKLQRIAAPMPVIVRPY
jgi:hypothetical protein